MYSCCRGGCGIDVAGLHVLIIVCKVIVEHYDQQLRSMVSEGIGNVELQEVGFESLQFRVLS